jgi:CRP-like cAMP-binding protein
MVTSTLTRTEAARGSSITHFDTTRGWRIERYARTSVESNRLLAALPLVEYDALLPHLQVVELPARKVLAFPEQRMEYVYFERTGLVSVLVPMEDGKSVEGAIVGNEGIVGLSAFLGDGVAREELVQIAAGHAVRLPVSIFRDVARRSATMQLLLSRYTLALMTHMARTAGCNRVHSVDQRLARLLLMICDRTGRATISLTHDVLAGMLGSRRASVTEAASLLSGERLIDYRRGLLTITNRAGLEQAVCEDYRLCCDAFERMFAEFSEVSIGRRCYPSKAYTAVTCISQ